MDLAWNKIVILSLSDFFLMDWNGHTSCSAQTDTILTNINGTHQKIIVRTCKTWKKRFYWSNKIHLNLKISSPLQSTLLFPGGGIFHFHLRIVWWDVKHQFNAIFKTFLAISHMIQFYEIWLLPKNCFTEKLTST